MANPIHTKLLLLLLILLGLAECQHKLWLAFDNKILSLSKNGNETMTIEDGRHVLGLSNHVLDVSNQAWSVFITELGISGPSVYRISGDSHERTKLLSPHDIEEKSLLYLESLVFDEVSRSLYLTSRSRNTIYKLALSSSGTGSASKLETFYSDPRMAPSGITMDTCSRTLYWSNSDRQRPSIMSLDLTSGIVSNLITSNISRPRAITLDVFTKKLYWTDSRRGHFWIRRSNTDGSDAEVVCEASYHDGFSITVDQDWIYWSDWSSHSVWKVSKYGDCKFQLVKSFSSSKPHGVMSIPSSLPTCENEVIDRTIKPTLNIANNSIQHTTTDSSVEINNNSDGGICVNFCLHGSCNANNGGNATCVCDDGWTGERCHVDLCHNTCLNNGTCIIIESEPECLCPSGFIGERCHMPESPESPESSQLNSTLCTYGITRVLVLVLGTSSGLLAFAVIILSLMVHRLRSRPRVVRKRFISVAGNGAPDKTASNIYKNKEPSPSCGLPVEDGIQFDIENCCNMVLCETPCFEPPTRGPKGKKGRKSKGGGASDKRSLLANCDEDD